MEDIRIRLGALPDMRVRINAPPTIRIRIGDVIVVHYEEEIYEGPYEVTPTQETQTLQTSGKTMIGDVVINPIPPQYGLIEYNGFYIRVS